MSIETWTQLKDALAANATGVFELNEGTFECDDGIILENKSDITIRGAGRGRTFIRVKKTVPDCFRLWSNVHNVTFSNFTMIGEVASDDDVPIIPNRGIATSKWAIDANGAAFSIYPTNLSHISFVDLEICNMTTGLQIGGENNAVDKRIANCIIKGNFIHHIYGKLPGYGYGIHTFHSPLLQIRDNVVHRATRHSVYYGNAESGLWTLIIGNTIVDAGLVAVEQSAMSIARSSNVTIAHNLFVRSKSYALSVEKVLTDDPPWDPKDVQLIDNRFIDSVGPDIWIDHADEVLIWHNTKQSNESASVLVSASYFEPQLWSGTERIDRVGDYLHIIQNGTAHLVKPNYDKKPTTSEAWPYTVLK